MSLHLNQDENRSGDISFAEVSAHSYKPLVTLGLNRVLYQFTGLWRYIEVGVLNVLRLAAW